MFRDSLSKCTGIFGRKQDRAVLEASIEDPKVGKLIKKENQWESSYNPHWVYKKYFLSDNGEVKKDAGF